jgi:hypothetical protein
MDEHGWDGFDGLSQIRMNNRDMNNYLNPYVVLESVGWMLAHGFRSGGLHPRLCIFDPFGVGR